MNARIKKKHMKNRIIHMQPVDLLVYEFDMNDSNFDMFTASQFMNAALETLPYNCGVALVPNYISVKSMDKTTFRAFLDKLENVYNGMLEE